MTLAALWFGGPVACGAHESPRSLAEQSETHWLNLDHSTLRWPVEASTKGLGSARFVAVDVVRVENTARVALIFEVDFESSSGSRTKLGTFSLYPADRPGRFIVPTLGRVATPGAIVVSMRSPDRIGDVTVKAHIGSIALVNDGR